MAVQGVTKDYLRIEYDKKDVLYVPVTQLDLLSRYTAPGDSENVKLSRLGGAEWTKTRKKVRAATEQMAKELIELYARRKRAHGHAFPPDDTWQGDFEQRFAYDERRTSFPARRRSNMIWSSLADGPPAVRRCRLRQDRGRAACRDEVHSRGQAGGDPRTDDRTRAAALSDRDAAFSGSPDHDRAAHALQDRLGADCAAQKAGGGLVDLVIGTHKLFNKKIKFKDLGLLVVDEEQRFASGTRKRSRK